MTENILENVNVYQPPIVYTSTHEKDLNKLKIHKLIMGDMNLTLLIMHDTIIISSIV